MSCSMGGRFRCARVAFTAFARSRLESISVPSRSKMTRSMGWARMSGPSTRFGAAPGGLHAARRLLTGTAVAQLVLDHFPLQRIAVDSEKFAGGATVAIGALDGARDKRLLQNLDGFFHEESVFQQVVYQVFECFFHFR